MQDRGEGREEDEADQDGEAGWIVARRLGGKERRKGAGGESC